MSYVLGGCFVAFIVLCTVAVLNNWSDLARASVVPSLIAVAYIGAVIINKRVSS
jgi:hypothetical protein